MAKSESSSKRKPNEALMRPVQPDEVLGAIVGSEPKSRGEITKLVWEYIRAQGLQDQTDKRKINTDDKMKALFDGAESATMFELTKFVNKHLKK